MKKILLALLLAVTGRELLAQPAPTIPAPGQTRVPRYLQPPPSFAAPAAPVADTTPEETVPPGYINFQGVDITQVLEVYAKLVNRTILRAGGLPDGKIILKTQTELTKTEAIEALQAVLALNNVSVINIGDKFVKAVPSDQANASGGAFNTNNAAQLPELGTFTTRIVQLRYVKPSEMLQVIDQFKKLPGAIVAIDSNGILVIRDYAENVKRMLEMIEQIDIAVPTEYISEVIPIRYAKVDDIASALNSLGGSSTAASIGSAPSSGRVSGLSGGGFSGSIGGGIGGGIGGNVNQSGGIGGGGIGGGIGGTGSSPFGSTGTQRPYGGTSAATGVNGTPSSRTSFADRLNNIVNRASSGGSGGQDQIQLFGQTKIIPNESSSTLLIYATRQDMEMIKGIIAKLDVPLAQVLIEAVIMDVTLGNTFNLGVSAAQNPKTGNNVFGGGINNGQSFLNAISQIVGYTTNNPTGTNPIVSAISSMVTSTGTNGAFASSLPGGFSYFGNIGPTWDIALNAAESDSHANIIQRPRIQTSQATPATFFVGNTVPYVTSTYSGYTGGYGGSSYSQLSVGVELDVTPFINPEGEVSMQIQQEIDDLNGYTAISGVGNVPNTIKRTLNTSITVRDRDTVMLGGFIKTDKSVSKSGVPFLSDIPLLGALFTQRADQKDREELIVLMRPTVLKTPELAARNTIKEAQRLPGVSAAAAESERDERKLIDAERKQETRNMTNGVNANGFFNMVMPEEPSTNAAPAATNTITAPPAAMDLPPVNPANAQQQAQADFQQKSAALDAPPAAITPSQKARLDALLNDHIAGKLTDAEYKAARDKILAEGR